MPRSRATGYEPGVTLLTHSFILHQNNIRTICLPPLRPQIVVNPWFIPYRFPPLPRLFPKESDKPSSDTITSFRVSKTWHVGQSTSSSELLHSAYLKRFMSDTLIRTNFPEIIPVKGSVWSPHPRLQHWRCFTSYSCEHSSFRPITKNIILKP